MKLRDLRVGDTVVVRVDGRERRARVRALIPRERGKRSGMVRVDLERGSTNIGVIPGLVRRRIGRSLSRGTGSRGLDAQTRED